MKKKGSRVKKERVEGEKEGSRVKKKVQRVKKKGGGGKKGRDEKKQGSRVKKRVALCAVLHTEEVIEATVLSYLLRMGISSPLFYYTRIW